MTRVNHRTTGIWALHVLRSFNKTLAGIVIKPLCGASVFGEQEPKYFLAGIAPCCDSKVHTADDDDDEKTTTGGAPPLSYNNDDDAADDDNFRFLGTHQRPTTKTCASQQNNSDTDTGLDDIEH